MGLFRPLLCELYRSNLSNCPLHLVIEFLDLHESQLVNEIHLFLLHNDGTLVKLSVLHVQNAEGGTESERMPTA